MTIVEPAPTRRRKRRTSTPVTSTTAPTRSRGVRNTRRALTVAWYVAPLIAAAHVDRLFGAAWGSIPLFWLDGTPPGPSIAGTLTLLAGYAVAVTLHRKHVIFLFGVLPALVAWGSYLWFDVGVAGWLGLGAGLGVGAIVRGLRRKRSR